ncbi:MAG TPA: TetR family transcriptional regulator [Pseudonocardiaceae bacterium]|nr:TetR family transcriptional regulator [Pseudonocardiaceae bacterium]
MAGLRERKKLETRAALSWAALNLAVEHGLENVLVEDIVAKANVSPRTFNNYFSSKEEAICAISTDRIDGIVAAFRARPADEALWDALSAAMLTPYDVPVDPDRDFVARSQFVLRHPALQAETMRAQLAVQDALTAEVAARLGLDPENDIYPRLVVGVATAALHAALRHWAISPGDRPFLPTLRAALEQVAVSQRGEHHE